MEFIMSTNVSFLHGCLNIHLAHCSFLTYQLYNEVISHKEIILWTIYLF